MKFRLGILGLVTMVLFLSATTPSIRADSSEGPYAVYGDIVSESGAKAGYVVFDRDTGEILDVTNDASDLPPGTDVVVHDGYVFPGLIDAHNHMHWNSIPMWRPGRTFANRYEWQADDEYDDEVRAEYRALQDAGLWDESLKYGELRALAGGTTLFQGTDDSPTGYLARNSQLDVEDWYTYSRVSDVTKTEPWLIAALITYLENQWLDRAFLHVGEGKRTDPRSLNEFAFLDYVGATLPGVVIIHGVALTDDDLDTMADNGMYLVWSPQSNLTLYGETADVVGALAKGVTVSLGADWSISGSDNLLEEMKVAWAYSRDELGGALTPTDLYRMVTVDAAEVMGVGEDPWGERLGKLKKGHQADLFLAPRFHSDPHRSLLMTYSRDIRLVFVDGKPLYGDRRLMVDLVDSSELDRVVVSKRKKLIDLIEPGIGDLGQQSYDDMLELLDGALEDVAPLVEDEPGQKPGFPRSLK